jgi:hypothetical protein
MTELMAWAAQNERIAFRLFGILCLVATVAVVWLSRFLPRVDDKR